MKPGDQKAFSLIEVLCAIALFTTATLAIIKCFMEHAAMPKVDQTAVALIADIDNCMTHRKDLGSHRQVHCLFAPNEHFEVECNEAPGGSNLKLWTLTLSGYPHVSKNIVARFYEYNEDTH
ncbi:MAG: prepilin-type N-terminal cleavage/methylation domain-containing protein [Puniceicoccales bacterium]|jgi:prepilin-type N-terminal cleavage/methylation domain-containing protein|nr:prepilin-type N-terminal cleavage/methylation domain-containing protein [Puniceicoccales bacterium]